MAKSKKSPALCEPAFSKSLKAFIDNLHTIDPEGPLPRGFHQRWEKLMNYFHQVEVWRLGLGMDPKKVDPLVCRGWATVDEERRRFDWMMEPPGDGKVAVPVVLSFHRAGWAPPSSLAMFILRDHPAIRAILSQWEEEGARGEVEREIRMAIAKLGDDADIVGFDDCADSQEFEDNVKLEDMIAGQRARNLDAQLCASTADYDAGWLVKAKKTRRFWEILRTAIDFGTKQGIAFALGDEDVVKASRSGILAKEGAKKGGRLENANAADDLDARVRAVKGFVERENHEPTALELCHELGGVRLKLNPSTLKRGDWYVSGDRTEVLRWNSWERRVSTTKARFRKS